MKFLIAAMFVLIGTWASAAAEVAAGSIIVQHAWARASPKGAVSGVAYLTLVNNGSRDDRLTAASSPVAENIQFHETKMEGGISKMRQLQAIELPPSAKVLLKPDSIHLMMRLNKQLREGETFPLTLDFQRAGRVEIPVKIGKVGAMKDMSGM